MLIKSLNIKARARALEHLGKNQIADFPTALTELMKNSYDAYARNVEIYTLDSKDPKLRCGAIIDNGCGISRKQIFDSWMVVGTESKLKKELLPEEDRFGLQIRETQGEKGIGRLSVAFLADVTLLVTKKIDGPFTAVLIDWRFFENPYLSFNDIEFPIADFENLNDLVETFYRLKKQLIKNFEFDDKNVSRKKAWQQFSNDEFIKNGSDSQTTQQKIHSFCINGEFNEKVISPWKNVLEKVNVEDGEQHGTAMFLLELRKDLSLINHPGDLEKNNQDLEIIQKDLVDTLRSFKNPLVQIDDSFFYSIYRLNHENEITKILDDQDVFNNDDFELLEHKVVGKFDNTGWFRGNVVAFGEDKGKVAIPPNIAIDPKSGIGSFSIKLGSFEQSLKMSSLTEETINILKKKADTYSGLLIFRDNLRVLPYGKVDTDFFEIEARRTLSAGDYFWSHRKMFGSIDITHKHNKSLRDKSSREGFIINSASRDFKSLIINLLIQLADKYFGGNSSARKELKKKEIDVDPPKKNKKISKKSIIEALKINAPILNSAIESADILKNRLESVEDWDIYTIKKFDIQLSQLEAIGTEIKILPKHLKILPQEKYKDYTSAHSYFLSVVSSMRDLIDTHEISLNKQDPKQVLINRFNKNQSLIDKQLKGYKSSINKKIQQLINSLNTIIEEDKAKYSSQAFGILSNNEDELKIEDSIEKLNSIFRQIMEEDILKYNKIINCLDKILE